MVQNRGGRFPIPPCERLAHACGHLPLENLSNTAGIIAPAAGIATWRDIARLSHKPCRKQRQEVALSMDLTSNLLKIY